VEPVLPVQEEQGRPVQREQRAASVRPDQQEVLEVRDRPEEPAQPGKTDRLG
jgi:hypothetical protein